MYLPIRRRLSLRSNAWLLGNRSSWLLVCLSSLASAQSPAFVDVRKSSLPLFDSELRELYAADLDRDGRVDLVLGSAGVSFGQVQQPAYLRAAGGGVFAHGPAVGQIDVWPRGVADVDGDGDQDVLAPAYLLINDGAGGLTQQAAPFRGASFVDRYAAADFDRDGRVDVFDGERLWLNQGALTFRDATAQLPAGADGLPLAFDLDADGDLDLAVLPVADARPRVLRNDGTGRFAELINVPGTAAAGQDLLARDLDGDGDLDLAAVFADRAPLLLINGGGFFIDGSSRLAGLGPRRTVAAGDVDGDGDLDLAFASEAGGALALNAGAATFVVDRARWSPQPGLVQDLLFLDGDGDGDVDLFEAHGLETLALGGTGRPVRVSWNDGAGFFRAGVVEPIDVPLVDVAMAVGDFNGDGDPDLLLGDGAGRAVRLGDGFGGFGRVLPLAIPGAGSPVVADLDRDGDLDAVLIGATSVAVLRNPGDGALSQVATLTLPPLGVGTAATRGALADFDRDGWLDLLVVTRGVREYFPRAENDFWFRGSSGGFLTPPVVLGPSFAEDVAVGDIDRDGDLDAVVDGDLIYVNAGNGTFTTRAYANPWNWGQGYLALVDLDGDGDLDLVSGNDCAGLGCAPHNDGPPDSVLWNDGAGNFATELTLQTHGTHTRATAVGDFDGDGDVDLAFGNEESPPQNLIVENLGAGVFRSMADPQSTVVFPADTDQTLRLLASDVDGDGDLDLIAGNRTPEPWSLPTSRVYVNLLRHLEAPDLLRLGLVYRLRLHGAPQGAVLVLAPGVVNVPTPLGRLRVDPATAVTVGVFGPPAQGRRIDTQVAVPRNPALLGVTLTWQAGVLAGGNLRLTNAVREPMGW